MNFFIFIFSLMVWSSNSILGMEPAPEQPSQPSRMLSGAYVPDISREYENELKRLEVYQQKIKDGSFDIYIEDQLKSGHMFHSFVLLLGGLYLQHEVMKNVQLDVMLRNQSIRIQEALAQAHRQMGQTITLEPEYGLLEITFSPKITTSTNAMSFLLSNTAIMQFLNGRTPAKPLSPSEIAEIARKLLPWSVDADEATLLLLNYFFLRLDLFYTSPLTSGSYVRWTQLLGHNKDLTQKIFVLGKKNQIVNLVFQNLFYLKETVEARALLEEIIQILAKKPKNEALYHKRRREFSQKLNKINELYKKTQPLYIDFYKHLAMFFKKYLETLGGFSYIVSVTKSPKLLEAVQEKMKENPNGLPLVISDFKNNPAQLPATLAPFVLNELPPLPAQKLWKEYQEKIEAQTAQKKTESVEKKTRKPRRRRQRPAITASAQLKETKESVQELGEEEESPEEIAHEPITKAEEIKKAADGSFVVEDNDTIKIQDPKNKITIILFKTDIPNKVTVPLPLQFTKNVQEWLIDPQHALENQGYLDPRRTNRYASTKEKKEEMIRDHSFGLAVDNYVSSRAFQASVQSREVEGQKDILLAIPGMIILNDGSQEMGVFAYIINSATGKCYHRMFTPEEFNRQFTELMAQGYLMPEMKGLYEVYFPPLGTQRPKKKS